MSIEKLKDALSLLAFPVQADLVAGNLQEAKRELLNAIQIIQDYIEEAEKQEPVGYVFESPNKTSKTKFDECPHGGKWQPVYKHPPKREWVGLTPNKFGAVYVDGYGYIDKKAYFAVDAKLKELNHVL